MHHADPAGLAWDVWYMESQPSGEVGSITPNMLVWSGRVGWCATIQ